MIIRSFSIKIAILIVSIASIFCVPDVNAKTLTETEVGHWEADIDYFSRQLEQHHINLYHTVSKQAFIASLDKLKNQLSKISFNQLMVEMSRVTRKIGDGHTQFQFWSRPQARFPIRFEYIEDHWRLTEAANEYKHLLGFHLVGVGTLDIKKVEDILGELAPAAENIYSLRERISWLLTLSDFLDGAGLSESVDKVNFQLVSKNGQIVHQVVSSVSASEFDHLELESLPKFKHLERESDSDLHIASSDKQAIRIFHHKSIHTTYIRLDRYPSFEKTISFMEKQAELMKRFDMQNIIIDLRANGGGDFFVGLGLAYPLILLDRIDWLNGVYVLTDSTTFSASMSNTAHYKQILNAKVVGTPTGARPVGYQDADTFLLPKSGIPIMYSKRFYRFQDQVSDAIYPDVLIHQSWVDRQVGIDTAYEWVIADIQSRLGKSQDNHFPKNH